MKRIIFLTSFTFIVAFAQNALAQGYNYVSINNKQLLYVGSLRNSGLGTFEKLKIEIFGGYWINTDLGTCTYSISTREGVAINREIHGGNGSGFQLKVYKTANGYDFVIEIITEYAAINIQSYLLNGQSNQITQAQYINITKYNPQGKEDVTSQYPINTIYSTSKTGNIGIGMANPTSKLEVNGTIRAKEVKIEASGWADFVFDKNYKLPSLKEVENHINKKQTLPGIPSEKEVKENGVDIGNMQVKLLQKIEELTLYVIDLKNENERQDKVIQQLHEKLKAKE